MKILPGAAALLLLSVSAVHAADHTLKNFEVTGNITQKACVLEPAQPVSITPISFNDLESASNVKTNGPGVNATMFTLSATNCTAGQVAATVEGTGDSTDADLLAIDAGANAAKNVAIAFASESPSTDGKVFLALNSGLAAPATGSGLDDLNHNFYFYAEPVKTDLTALPGTVHATAQLHIVYL